MPFCNDKCAPTHSPPLSLDLTTNIAHALTLAPSSLYNESRAKLWLVIEPRRLLFLHRRFSGSVSSSRRSQTPGIQRLPTALLLFAASLRREQGDGGGARPPPPPPLQPSLVCLPALRRCWWTAHRGGAAAPACRPHLGRAPRGGDAVARCERAVALASPPQHGEGGGMGAPAAAAAGAASPARMASRRGPAARPLPLFLSPSEEGTSVAAAAHRRGRPPARASPSAAARARATPVQEASSASRLR